MKVLLLLLHMDNHPVGWPLLYETPLGMFCLYGKVMRIVHRVCTCSYLIRVPSELRKRSGENLVGSSKVSGSRRNFLRLQMTVAPLGIVHFRPLEVNSIALLKSQQTFQQTFQQSFYSSVAHPVVLTTMLKILLKSLLRFN